MKGERVIGGTPTTADTSDPVGTETMSSAPGRFETARAQWRQALGERGRFECPHCAEDFSRPGYRALHLGRQHPKTLTEDDEAAFEAAREAESGVMDEIALHTKSGLFALPLFLLYAATLVLLIELDANVAWVVMSTPGYVLFAALFYSMAYGYFTGGKDHYHGHD